MDALRSQFDLEEWTRTFSRGQQCSCFRTRNTFCRTRSLSNATFSFFDYVMKIGWFFTEIWRYIDFQNSGRPLCWNCFTTIRDHLRSPCCWPQLPVKFHVNLIHRSEDNYSCSNFFAYLALNAYSGLQNWGFGGLWTLNCDYSSSRPPKGTSLRKSVDRQIRG